MTTDFLDPTRHFFCYALGICQIGLSLFSNQTNINYLLVVTKAKALLHNWSLRDILSLRFLDLKVALCRSKSISHVCNLNMAKGLFDQQTKYFTG